MAYQNFYPYGGSYSSFPQTSPPQFFDYNQPTSYPPPYHTNWDFYYNNSNPPQQECFSNGLLPGLDQFDTIQGPTSEIYYANSELECWNSNNFTFDSTYQNCQSNICFTDPTSPPVSSVERMKRIDETMEAIQKQILENNQILAESSARMEQIMTRLDQYNFCPNPDNQDFEQVNHVIMPPDSTSQFHTSSESGSSSFHLNQFEDLEQEKEVHKFETHFQSFHVPPFEQFFDDDMSEESPNDKCVDLFEDDSFFLDELFQEDGTPHTISVEHIDNDFENVCVNTELLLLDEQYENEINNFCAIECVEDFKHVDEFLLLDKKFEQEFDKFCEEKFVEKHELPLKHVEKFMKTPFERKPLDLSIFTFDEQSNNKIFDDNVNDKFFLENIEVGNIILKQHVDRNYWEDIAIFVVEDKFVEDVWRKIKRRKLRKLNNKVERMRKKLTKRLSSSLCPLKRTHWNDGKRARGNRPRKISVWI